MKYNGKKTAFLVLCLVLALQLLCMSVFASETTLEWTLSEDEETLSNAEKTYEIYDFEIDCFFYPIHVYEYYNQVYLAEDGYYSDGSCNIYAPSRDAEIVWVEGEEYCYVYTTETGSLALGLFERGSTGNFRIWFGDSYADLNRNSVMTMESIAAQKSDAQRKISVSALLKYEMYEIIVHDETDTVAYVRGAIYNDEGSLYYLDYMTLGNQYFDADGNFSYRSGSVTLTPLSAEFDEEVKAALANLMDYTTEYEYESGYEGGGSTDISPVMFWIGFVFVGFLLPIPFLVFGLILPRIKKLGRPKYWYSLSIIAAVWLLMALILLVLLLL